MSSAGAIYPDLTNKVVLVTGGASGIGEFIVRAFHRQGCKVGLIDILDDAGNKLAAELGERVRFAHANIIDVPELQKAIEMFEQTWGGIDVLVNNAARDDREETLAVTPQRWDEQIAVNLSHQFFAAQTVIKSMKEQGRGVIINFSSISWRRGVGGMAPYTTCKAAINGLTRSLARDFGAFNIRVNTISPGWILTERQQKLWVTPEDEKLAMDAQCLKRWLMPDEIAKFVVFLASDDASACTSQEYIVDGGWV